MSKKAAYVGVNGVARKVKHIYVGVKGIARQVTKGYVGVKNTAHQWWGDGSGGDESNYIYIEPSQDYEVNTEYPVTYADTVATLVYALEIIRKVCKSSMLYRNVYDNYKSHIGEIIAICRELMYGNTIIIDTAYGSNYVYVSVVYGNTSLESFKSTQKYENVTDQYVNWWGVKNQDNGYIYVTGEYINFSIYADGSFTYRTGSSSGGYVKYIGTHCDSSDYLDTVYVCNMGMINSIRSKKSDIDWHWTSSSKVDTIDGIKLYENYPTIDANNQIMRIPFFFGRGRTIEVEFSSFERKYTIYNEGEANEYRSYSHGTLWGIVIPSAGQYSNHAVFISFDGWSSNSSNPPTVSLHDLYNIVQTVEFSSEEEMRTCLSGGTLTMTWASDGSGVTFDINGIVTLTADWDYHSTASSSHGALGKVMSWENLYEYTVSEITIK